MKVFLDAFSNTKYRFVFNDNAPGYVYHAHEGIELFYIHEGSGQVIVDKKNYAAGKGTFMFYQPFQIHCSQMNTNSGQPYSCSYFIFDPVVVDNYLQTFPSLRKFFKYIWKGEHSSQAFNFNCNSTYLDKVFTRFQQRYPHLPESSRTEEQILFLVELLQLLRNEYPEDIHMESKIKTREYLHVEKIMQWIEEHYMEEFKLEKLASGLFLSPDHVSRLFSRAAGLTISEYLINRRLKQAAWLLKTTDLPIKDIVGQIGLNDVSYFSKLFKKRLGVSPQKYRR